MLELQVKSVPKKSPDLCIKYRGLAFLTWTVFEVQTLGFGDPTRIQPTSVSEQQMLISRFWWSARHNRPQPVLHLSSQLRSCLIHRDKFDKSPAMWVQWCLMPSRKPRCFWSKNAVISSLKTSSGSSSQRRIIPHDHRDHGCLKKILVPTMSLTLLNQESRRAVYTRV